jgi:hypothetical protein
MASSAARRISTIRTCSRDDAGRAEEDARAGVHAQRGSGRSRHQLDPSTEGVGARPTVLRLLRAGRDARAASRAQGVGRQVQRQVRSGMGQAARGNVRAAEDARRDPEGVRAHQAPCGDPGVGRGRSEDEAGAVPADGSVCRLHGADRPPRRPGARRTRQPEHPRRDGGLSDHRRQRRISGRIAARARSTRW